MREQSARGVGGKGREREREGRRRLAWVRARARMCACVVLSVCICVSVAVMIYIIVCGVRVCACVYLSAREVGRERERKSIREGGYENMFVCMRKRECLHVCMRESARACVVCVCRYAVHHLAVCVNSFHQALAC